MELNQKITAIIQARMGSKRLPGKILKTIQGKPMLWHIVNRLKMVDEINEIIIATSEQLQDDPVFQMAEKYSISSFRGSEKDVLKRYFDTAVMVKADHLIRITGDCPVIDPQTISSLIKLYFDGNYDFCGISCGAGAANESNIRRFPDGLDAEIFSFKVLRDAHLNALSDLHREHVTPYIWQNKYIYNTGTLQPRIGDYSDHRWTVDNIEDFEFISWIYDMLYPSNQEFNLNDILDLLKKNPVVFNNNHFIGQEGYEKFWRQD